MDRRKFLTKTTGIASLSLAPFTYLNATTNMQPNSFKPIVLATNWGYEGTLDSFCTKVKKAGYDGIEMWWPMEHQEQELLFAALKKHDLAIGFLCGVGEEDASKHIAAFKNMVNSVLENAQQKPLYINCHSGKDYFSFDANNEIIEFTIAQSKKSGIPICHETHRSRMLYSAPNTKLFMEKNEALRITLDISHWCNVHESLLHDQEKTVQMALTRTDHIHARIGHAEGPQVNDPRAPEWETTVQRHFEWWDAVVQMKIKNGATTMTFLTEFGPPNYMPTMPYTQQPLSNQWEINVYMMQLIRKRYQVN
jgi:sugar phosphate isomerase/epimerase